jgi:hypothetical protein
MAASIGDIEADTAYVDDTQSALYCESVAAYDAAKTETARQYVAGLTVFTFIWAAYEAAVAGTRAGHLVGLHRAARNGERGRRLFEDFPADFPTLETLSNVGRLAEVLCKRGDLFDERLKKLRDKTIAYDFVFSAEICREFRNFVVHGEDKAPEHEDWHYGRQPGESIARIRRFYAIGRLLLLMIQALARAGIAKGKNEEIEWGVDDDYEPLMCDPRHILSTLHLNDNSA